MANTPRADSQAATNAAGTAASQSAAGGSGQASSIYEGGWAGGAGSTNAGKPSDVAKYAFPVVPTNQLITSSMPILDAITAAVVAAHPELQLVRDLVQAGQDAAAYEALTATDYYKTFTGTKLANEQLRLNKPQAYEDTIANEWLPALRKYVTQEGLQVTDADLATIAKSAFDMGLQPGSPGTLALFQKKDEKTGQPFVTGIVGGIAGATRQNLKTAAADYGVYFDSESAAKQIALGTTTEQEQLDAIKSLAKGAFPGWEKQIDAGLSMKQIASPYISTYANILGIDSAGITLSDNLLKQGLQGTDPKTPGAMPLWEFEKAVRKDPRWANSKDAMDSLSSTGSTILKQWGLMS